MEFRGLITKLDFDSVPPGCHASSPPGETAGILCYVLRRFQSKSLDDQNATRNNSRKTSEIYEVRVIDNDHNTYQQVIDITMIALGINEDDAFAIAWEVDHIGYCVVAQGDHDHAEAIAAVIRSIGIEVQVNLINKS